MPGQMQLFPTPIWGFSLPEHKALREACAAALRERRDRSEGVSKSNMLGWQSTDTLHRVEPFSEVAALVEAFVAQAVLPEYPRVARFELTNLWGNINPPGATNLGHTHEHALSGAFYLEVPENSGRIAFIDPRIRNRGELGEDRVLDVACNPGGCVIFPAWLEHFVEPNRSEAERLSLAFNLRAHLHPPEDDAG